MTSKVTATKAARLYSLQRAIFASLRPDPYTKTKPDLETLARRHVLSQDEATALVARDIRALYLMGVHSVLLNSFARANGMSREVYANLLSGLPSGLGTGHPATSEQGGDTHG